jgi:hypothetical protein
MTISVLAGRVGIDPERCVFVCIYCTRGLMLKMLEDAEVKSKLAGIAALRDECFMTTTGELTASYWPNLRN